MPKEASQSGSATAGWETRRLALSRSRRALVIFPLMYEKVNLSEKLRLLDRPYQPGIVGRLNDYKLMVVKLKGPFVWHKHDDTDDFFLVLRGCVTIQLRDGHVELREGEMFVVPRGVEHCPNAEEEAYVLLIEPAGTLNTGDAGGELTAEEHEI